ncbi:MAG: calcium-transporting P-type ATPase, PMR1-type [Candidatus Micrarchaeota archaeon]|nr:calcium-transporting P-type ATPase, PMR1-type [Candidatus Micrarchaeota archaeon]
MIPDEKGLSESEARELLEKYGANELKGKARKSALALFLSQFNNILLILLILAALVAIVVSDEMLEPIAIFAAVLISATIGFVQEYRAEDAMESLKRIAPMRARVMREGKDVMILAHELVPGDIVTLEAGDRVPADLRILWAVNLRADESALTGESVSAGKSEKGSPSEGALYMGTTITHGRAMARVVYTGMRTEMGKIAQSLTGEEGPTPLQRTLDSLGRQIGIAGIALCVIFFVWGLARAEDPTRMLILAVSLAVAAVPEGLPTTVAITLAIGMQHMARRNAIVRRLPAVETLGSVTVICSDKTGTITKNQMTVRKLFIDGKICEVTGAGYTESGKIACKKTKTLETLVNAAVLCNYSNVSSTGAVTGDPMEAALLVLAGKAGESAADIRTRNPMITEKAFDSERKMMTTIDRVGGGAVAFTKGAPERLLSKCSRVMVEGRISKLTKEEKGRILHVNSELASSSLRVIAFASRELRGVEEEAEVEHDLVFLGLAGMSDPPRDEIKEAVATCRRAGIRPVMITGDNEQTARAIAIEIGLLETGMKVITGEKLDVMSDRELRNVINSVAVYARVSPEHKLRIIDALKAKKEIVAMTGDGVNDAPALKRADIGVAMGTGTDVAKDASEIVLTDDNFATIVKAVEYGRNIFDNIRNFVRFQFSTNIAALSIMFISPFLSLPLPLRPIQILWINVIMDGPPALALGLEPSTKDVMGRPPRNQEMGILSGIGPSILLTGILMTAGTLFILWSEPSGTPDLAKRALTMTFTAFVVFQLFNAFNCRSERRSLLSKPLSNTFLLAAVFASALLQLLIIYNPLLQQVFHTVPLSAGDWVKIIAVASTIIIAEEIRKLLARRNESKR